jgi:non-ribosomal peptide synthetase component F
VPEADRFSPNFEITFDLSVFDMFMPWLHGAGLFVAPRSQQGCPSDFVAQAELTIWFSVPSLAFFIQRMRGDLLGAFPKLRWSLFCGERLPNRIAYAWALMAPNSCVENLYGPPEVTIACTAHTFDPHTSPAPETLGNVPIGHALPGHAVALVDDALERVPAGQAGELCMSGPQVTLGYLGAPAQTRERFLTMPWDRDDPRRVWYRTGDLVAYLPGSDVLTHLGRTDEQVKVRGYRVELGEVEFALRKVVGTDAVAVVAVPRRDTELVEIVAFIAGESFDEAVVRERLGEALPAYMHPSRLVAMTTLPLTSNGKVDKVTLRTSLEDSHDHA